MEREVVSNVSSTLPFSTDRSIWTDTTILSELRKLEL